MLSPPLASSEVPGLPGAENAADPGLDEGAANRAADARFRSLVQSPLRAELLVHFHRHPAEAFDGASLVHAVARIPVDIANCVSELVAHGLVRRLPGPTPRYAASRPDDPSLRRRLEEFLAAPRPSTPEERSPSFRRLRELIGVDEKMLLVLESIRTVAKTDISTLILGPTGVGKEVVARVIHELSARRERTFQAVSGAALPDTLFESEMFGYERGAFTGATDRKPGKMELANGGTLFLDEVGDLSPVAQVKLLRALEERTVERLGGRQNIRLDFRLVSATNRPLDVLSAEGRFREDLFYRVNAFTIHLPSLRERPSDIPILAARFLAAYCGAQGLSPGAKVFSGEALERMSQYAWPGNIREMVATVSRAALSSHGRTVEAGDVLFMHADRGAVRSGSTTPGIVPLRQIEREHIERALQTVSWNKKRAARLLEVSRETLYRKIRTYQLTPSAGVRSSGGPGR